MSVLDALCVSPVSVSVATTEVLQRKQHNPVLQRLRRLMDSAGEETDADSESLELALLDVELTKYAAHEGIHIPAASPATSAGGSSLAHQLSTAVISPKVHSKHTKSKPMQPGTVLQLVQQQSKFLDVLQCMIDKNVGTDKPQQHQQQQHKASTSHSTAVQAAAPSSSDAAAAGGSAGAADGELGAPAAPGGGSTEAEQQLGVLQVQYERQVADNQALKKRCLKVQKAMLKHMQAARAQAAAAEAACEEAHRREQQAAAANAALQSQLSQQQHMLEAQQQQLSGMQEQLLQLKDLHKKKLTRYKVQLQQQYESQLEAATSAYTQELSLVHAVQLSGERFNSSAGGASACSDGHPTPRQVTKKARPSTSNAGTPPTAAQHSVLASASGCGAGNTAAAAAAAAPAAATAPTAGSATKKPPAGQTAGRTQGGSSGRSSGGGSKAAATAAASGAPVASDAVSNGGAGRATAGAARVSDSGSRRQSQADADALAAVGAAAAAAAAASQVDVEGLVKAGARLHRPSLPLEGELSGHLLHQLSLSSNPPDPFSGAQQGARAGQAGQAAGSKQRRVGQGTSGGGQRAAPETPRRATVNGSGPRMQQAAAESRAARSKSTPPALGMDGPAPAAATNAAAEPAAAAAGSGVGVPAAAAASAEASRASLHFGDAPPAVDSSVAVAVAQQLQSHLLLLLAQQLAEHLPPELADIDPHAILSLQQAVAGHADHAHQQQPQQQQEAAGDNAYEEGIEEEEEVEVGEFGTLGQQQQQHSGGAEGEVPEDVLHYAQQYQQGFEGGCRPSTAAPSALQHQRQQQVPEAAAQLAQHFVAGGEGTSRPLTAPSSDRNRPMQQQQQAQHGAPRPSSPSGRGSRQAGMRNEHPSAAALGGTVAVQH